MSLLGIAEAFMKGLSLTSKTEDVSERIWSRIEERLNDVVRGLKRKVYLMVAEIAALFLGVALLFAGLVVFLSRYFSLEWVLIGMGLLMLYAGMMVAVLKK